MTVAFTLKIYCAIDIKIIKDGTFTFPFVIPRSEVETIVSTSLLPILALRLACLQCGTKPYTTCRDPLNKDMSSCGA